jgi:hypothetical protein
LVDPFFLFFFVEVEEGAEEDELAEDSLFSVVEGGESDEDELELDAAAFLANSA